MSSSRSSLARFFACFAAAAALLLAGATPALSQDDVTCEEFQTQEEAQDYYESTGRPRQLDPDNNGRACESLPRESQGDTPGQVLPDDNGDEGVPPLAAAGAGPRASTPPRPAPAQPAAAAASNNDALPKSGSNTVWMALWGVAAVEAGWALLLLSGRLSPMGPAPWLRGRRS